MEHDVGGTYGMNGGEETYRLVRWCGWEDNIKCIFELGLVGVDWIHLVQFRVKWRAVVNTEMNLHVPQYAGNFMSA